VALRAIEEHALGLSWVVDETMTRTSHALADGGRVWLIDPVDEPDAIERARALGEPAAVVQLLDRHNRDCAALASRLGVAHLRLPESLPGTPLEVVEVVRVPLWQEVALWWPARRALVVAEAVGSNPMFTGGGAPLGVHLMLRLTPPRRLAAYAPEHVLVGHGSSVHGAQAAPALHEALARSRRDLPRVLARLPRALRG
jgi:hypothetical protein